MRIVRWVAVTCIVLGAEASRSLANAAGPSSLTMPYPTAAPASTATFTGSQPTAHIGPTSTKPAVAPSSASHSTWPRKTPKSGIDGPAIDATPPDPAPLSSATFWVFDLKFDKGDLRLLDVSSTEFPRPMQTAREFGRFALELYEGAALIERTRFDFPLLGAEELSDKRGTIHVGRRLTTRVGVLFPQTSHGTKLDLVDRATGTHYALPWVPTVGVPTSIPADNVAVSGAAAPDANALRGMDAGAAIDGATPR